MRKKELVKFTASNLKTKKISIGHLNSINAIQKALRAKGIKIGYLASQIINSSDFSSSGETELELVIISLKDLGLKSGSNINEIYHNAKRSGLKLCSVEIALTFRLQFTDQQENEWLCVAMNPILDLEGDPLIFYLGNSETRSIRLEAILASKDELWDQDRKWVFVK